MTSLDVGLNLSKKRPASPQIYLDKHITSLEASSSGSMMANSEAYTEKSLSKDNQSSSDSKMSNSEVNTEKSLTNDNQSLSESKISNCEANTEKSLTNDTQSLSESMISNCEAYTEKTLTQDNKSLSEYKNSNCEANTGKTQINDNQLSSDSKMSNSDANTEKSLPNDDKSSSDLQMSNSVANADKSQKIDNLLSSDSKISNSIAKTEKSLTNDNQTQQADKDIPSQADVSKKDQAKKKDMHKSKTDTTGYDDSLVIIKMEPMDDDDVEDASMGDLSTTLGLHNALVKLERSDEAVLSGMGPTLAEMSGSGFNIKTEALEAMKSLNKKGKSKNQSKKEPKQFVEKIYTDEDRMKQIQANEINAKIETCTISEDDRHLEHKLMLDKKQHMKYICSLCAIGFVVNKAYEKHMEIHIPDPSKHECDICHSFLKTPRMVYQHRLRHYRRYRCLVCEQLFKEKDGAVSHIKIEHQRAGYECGHCRKTFKRPAYLKIHIEQHHTKEETYACPICAREFHSRSWFRWHVRSHDEEVRNRVEYAKYVCDACSKTFKKKETLRKHVVQHMDRPHLQAVCEICYHVYKNKEVLKRHMKRDHFDKESAEAERPVCPHCSGVFTNQSLLRLHIRRKHSGHNKPHQCDHCKRCFFSKGEARSHIMWSHMRDASTGHVCQHCGKQYRTPALHRAHIRNKHQGYIPPRDKTCGDCGKAFASLQVLNRHMKSCHLGVKYPCTECGEEFCSPQYVKFHYQLKHLNMSREEIKAKRRALRKPNGTLANSNQPKEDVNTVWIPEQNYGCVRYDININDVGSNIVGKTSDDSYAVEVVKEEREVYVTPTFETLVEVKREIKEVPNDDGLG